MKRVSRQDAWEYAWAVQDPRLVVEPGEPFVLETNDAFNGMITSTEDHFNAATFGEVWLNRRINPLAGPVWVEGAEPGDTLIVDILEIIPAATGLIATEDSRGPLMAFHRYPEAQETFTVMLEHRPGPSGTTSDGTAHTPDGVSWPLAPMIGCIGTVPLRPEQGSDSLGMQSRFGGNLDVTDIRKGNRLHLPVAQPGALLYVGDVHGSQSTEFQGSANETAAEVVLSCSLVRGREPAFARIETAAGLIQLCSRRPWEDAVQQAYFWMLEWLVEEYGMAPKEAVMHFNGNPECQVRIYSTSIEGNARGSVGVAFPKSAIRAHASKTVADGAS